MRLTRGNFWGSPPPVGNFASMCTSAVDLSMANWLNAGRKSTSKTSSASLPAPFSRPHEGDLSRIEPANGADAPAGPRDHASEGRSDHLERSAAEVGHTASRREYQALTVMDPGLRIGRTMHEGLPKHDPRADGALVLGHRLGPEPRARRFHRKAGWLPLP